MRLFSTRVLATVALACLSLYVSPAAAAPAGPQNASQMTIDFLTRDDADLRAIGLERVRYGLKGQEFTLQLAGLLPKLAPARQLELTAALSDRGDRAALPAVLSLLQSSSDAAVRATAIQAVGALGGAPEVAVLTKSLATAEPEKSAARRALAVVRGADATALIAAACWSGPTPFA